MLKFFMVLAAVLLSLLGLCEIVHLACVLILRPSEKSKKLLVIFPDDGNCEQEILLCLHELSWHGSSYADAVAVVTAGVSDDEARQNREHFRNESVLFIDKIEDLKLYS